MISDKIPCVEASLCPCSVQGMTSEDLKQVNGLLQEQIEANLGMAMIYTLVSILKEWLQDQVTPAQAVGTRSYIWEFQRDKFH